MHADITSRQCRSSQYFIYFNTFYLLVKPFLFKFKGYHGSLFGMPILVSELLLSG